MTELWDTTVRLLSQEPLARHVSTARLLELAGVLDRAGFTCLEVSGGGCFDALVSGGVESAWERIRAGASLVQLYTAMVYEGPGIARRIAEGLAQRLKREGFANISEAVGTERA